MWSPREAPAIRFRPDPISDWVPYGKCNRPAGSRPMNPSLGCESLTVRVYEKSKVELPICAF